MTGREIDLIRKLAMLVSKRTYYYLKLEEETDQLKRSEYTNKILDLREKISDVEAELMELEVVE
ncbi:Uncharacterised protein [Sebaldella termitidis]|uniref:Uncharacterized protein n=1 Tax=Sebaldella termitidis (strain ATCC 33386 / NCTC 11300) TaxID=526218 RepID=D1ANC3_SEBTE|nr:hypothetical protein [Sebaldella termitidis]ACZ09727.1 hypothetical protein Sterm_2883 [Sebaldella termitidis ATCC 33386]SUI25058.1 Uncharacterised protein [Sebaldella termitidis]